MKQLEMAGARLAATSVRSIRRPLALDVEPQRREGSAYVLHDSPDPDVFVAEIDVAFDEADGRRTTMSLLQIFRLRDGQIAMLRDYLPESLVIQGRPALCVPVVTHLVT